MTVTPESRLVMVTARQLSKMTIEVANNAPSSIMNNRVAFCVTVATVFLATALRAAFKGYPEEREDAMVDAFQAIRDMCEHFEEGGADVG